MKKNYPVAIVGFILLMSVDCLIMGTVLSVIGWLLRIAIGFKVVMATGFILLLLQLLYCVKK